MSWSHDPWTVQVEVIRCFTVELVTRSKDFVLLSDELTSILKIRDSNRFTRIKTHAHSSGFSFLHFHQQLNKVVRKQRKLDWRFDWCVNLTICSPVSSQRTISESSWKYPLPLPTGWPPQGSPDDPSWRQKVSPDRVTQPDPNIVHCW